MDSKGLTLISWILRTSFWCLIGRLGRVAILAASTLVAHPAAVAEQLDHPAPIRVPRVPDTWEVTATDDSIYFDQGSSLIGEDAAEVIRRHATKLRAMPGLKITLIAHTGDLGSSSLELARGQDRLEAVRNLLKDLKISLSRIRIENQGSESRNAQPCVEDECRSRNRRVDILFNR